MRFMLVLAMLALLPIAAAEFQRPWENESWVSTNPNIWTFGKSFWWNLPEFQQTIETAKLQEASRLMVEKPAADHLSQALKSADKAKKDLDECTVTLFLAMGYFPSFPSMAFISIFSNSSSCVFYRSDWTSAVDSTLLADEDSIYASRRAVSDARADFERMRFAGLCDENYTGGGSSDCAELAGAFNTVDSNITEGDYGKYPLILEYSGNLNRALSAPVPDISASATILGLAWGESGAIQSFRSAQSKSRSALVQAQDSFQQSQKSASARKALAESKLEELGAEGISDIGRAPSGFSAGGGGSIRERYSSLMVESNRIESIFTDSKLWSIRTGNRGYLANAVSGMVAADEGYAALLSDAGSLKADAVSVIDDQKEDAGAELSRTEKYLASGGGGQEAAELFEEANVSYASAGSAGTLGVRFERYSDAAALARAARNAKSYEDELDDRASLGYLKALIEAAEKDKINVISEKESLKLIPSLPSSMRGDAARGSVDSIISKARQQYEAGLLGRHKMINDRLMLAGDGAADLYTDLAGFENGLISDEGLNLPDAIGHLKKLEEEYTGLETTLDTYASAIVGNAMSIRTNPLIASVRLDEPADITLDAVMSNPRQYNATHVCALIKTDSPAEFVYSDIVSGKDDVESVRTADGGKGLAVIFSSVAPFETKRVVFSRRSVLAHTVSSASSAEGLGDGKAGVSAKVDFELDCDITGLELPANFEDGQIDGMPVDRPLSKGTHTLVSSNIVLEAYNESVENIKTYRIGTNSKVEYDIRIKPGMDLDSVPVFIDSLNSTRVSSFSIVSATGEAVREKERISETQYSARISGLKNGKEAVLKVSYCINDTESYVRERLADLDGLDLGLSGNSLLGQAKLQAAGGNSSEALALIEKAVASSKQAENEDAKLREQSDSVEKTLRAELDELESALSSSNSTAPFMQKLIARRNEIQRVLAEADGSNLTEKAALLENADQKWLDKELVAFKKEAYSRYNDLKERFFEAGNTTTPAEFVQFEDAFRKLESGNRLEYAVESLSALDGAENVVVAQETFSSSKKTGFKSLLDSVKADARDTLEKYMKQAAAAKGTDYSSLFTETEKKVEILIADAEDAEGGEPRAFLLKLDDLNKSRERMGLTLASLKNESEARLSMLESIIASKEMPSESRASLESKAESMRSMISSGDYVNALRAGSAISKELDSQEPTGGNGVLVLGVTALAVLAAVGVFVSRQPKQKKELKKLISFSGPAPPEQRHQQAGQGQPGRSSRNSPAHGHPRYSPPVDSKPEAPSV